MRIRITVRGEGTELRGYLDMGFLGEGDADLRAFAKAMQPFGVVIASPADDDYNPFKDWHDE